MKQKFTMFVLLCVFSNLNAQPENADSVFHFMPDGSKSWYYYQRDVAFFRLAGGAAYTGTTSNIITSLTHLTDHPDQYNMITFDTSATDFQIQVENTYLNGYTGFEYGFLAVTHEKFADASANLWYMPSDEIIVIFRKPSEGYNPEDDVEEFMERNNLTLHHAPDGDLPDAPYGWAYIFKLNGLDRFQPFEACQKIWLNEQMMVYHCEPDLQLYKISSCQDSPEMTANALTNLPDALWHIRNNGAGIRLNPLNSLPISGSNGADADICECWGEGYHGEGITVAVCDRYGFDFTHPDMSGQYLQGYDCVNLVSFNTTYYPTADQNEHGGNVASVIAALANTGANTKAVGVAYASQIRPYYITGNSGEIIIAIQQAVLDQVDIFNLSLATKNDAWTFSNLFTSIQNAITVGRNGNGMIFVAPVSNENQSGRFWPAMDVGVMGVGATLPTDNRAVPQQWYWTGGSNYYTPATPALHYDCVAPGTAIQFATTDRGTTPATQKNGIDNGTSYATPIVSGIAAIILSQYNTATYQNVIDMINLSADKVDPSAQCNYNFFGSIPGYDPRMFHGRVNCISSLNNPTAGLHEQNMIQQGINFAYIDKDENAILFSKGTNDKGSIVKIYDISGRLIESETIEPNKNTYFLNTSKYSEGVFVVNITTNMNKQANFKYIK